MPNTLGGITIPEDLVISEARTWTGIQAVVDRAVDGSPLVYEAAQGGMPITLIGTPNSAIITKSTYDQILSLASTPGNTVSLVFEGTTYTVRFRNEEPPTINATPFVERPNQADADYYHSVIIKLMEV